jgi:glyoxylase-like metal-dependent hydrolase (beta-lactamase superfamily II)
MQVAPGVEMLELSATLMDGPGTLCPTLLWDRNDVVLVDAGLPGMVSQFREAIGKAGVSFEALSRIIVTHHDLDHIGSLGELQQAMPHPVEVLSHPEEVPYIQGERPPIKMTPEMRKKMEQQMKDLPSERRQEMQETMEKMKNQKLKVNRLLSDGEILPFCGGIQVIHTPGHTPGHICLYLPKSRTLIAGDALFVDGGNLGSAPSFINADDPMALASLKKLMRCDIDQVIAYHGGLFQSSPNQKLAQILSENEKDAR